MPGNKLPKGLSVVTQALAEKHNVSQAQVEEILGWLPQRDLARLDWKDIDAIVQEGIVSGVGGEESFEEIDYDPEWKYRAGYNSAAGYRD